MRHWVHLKKLFTYDYINFFLFCLKKGIYYFNLEVGKNYVLQNTETIKIKCYRFNYFNFCIIFLRTVLITTLKKILFENKIT